MFLVAVGIIKEPCVLGGAFSWWLWDTSKTGLEMARPTCPTFSNNMSGTMKTFNRCFSYTPAQPPKFSVPNKSFQHGLRENGRTLAIYFFRPHFQLTSNNGTSRGKHENRYKFNSEITLEYLYSNFEILY
jgi:hypothetical protein